MAPAVRLRSGQSAVVVEVGLGRHCPAMPVTTAESWNWWSRVREHGHSCPGDHWGCGMGRPRQAPIVRSDAIAKCARPRKDHCPKEDSRSTSRRLHLPGRAECHPHAAPWVPGPTVGPDHHGQSFPTRRSVAHAFAVPVVAAGGAKRRTVTLHPQGRSCNKPGPSRKVRTSPNTVLPWSSILVQLGGQSRYFAPRPSFSCFWPPRWPDPGGYQDWDDVGKGSYLGPDGPAANTRSAMVSAIWDAALL